MNMVGLAAIILLIVTVIFFSYLRLKQRLLFWERRRIPHLKPGSIFLGNITKKLSLTENVQKFYEGLAPHRFGGIFLLFKPTLLVRDSELVKNIMIKDFHHFHDRQDNFSNETDGMTKNLFHLAGEEWRVLRQKLTPTFTSGKMKILFGLMKKCVLEMEEIVYKSVLNKKTVIIRDLMARYATDVISSCAFGLEASSLRDPNSEFRLKGKESLIPNWETWFRNVLFSLSPTLVHFLRLKIFPRHTTNFFAKLVRDTIEYRNKNGSTRNDFLDTLMKLQKEEKEKNDFEFSNEFLTAQCFIFFLAGFETSSTILSFILYELAEHPNIQKTLQDEIDHVIRKHSGQVTYDCIKEMRLMDQVFNETSRLYPALPLLERVCTQNYRIPDSDYEVKKGESVIIPVYGLHRDPQYYPDPNKFNPENFSEDAKSSRPSCCFLPFGDGPRNCIGQRFGIMQVKLALVVLLKQFTVSVAPEMELPITFLPDVVTTTPRNEILLNFHERYN